MEQVQQFLPFILMFVVIYFFMIRPQQKRVKQEKQFEADIKVGDKIVTKSDYHWNHGWKTQNGAFGYFNGIVGGIKQSQIVFD